MIDKNFQKLLDPLLLKYDGKRDPIIFYKSCHDLCPISKTKEANLTIFPSQQTLSCKYTALQKNLYTA